MEVDIVQKNGQMVVRFLEETHMAEQVPPTAPEFPSELQKSYVSIDDIGRVTIPPRFWVATGIRPNESVWVVLSESAIIIKKTAFGYRGCDMEQCMMDADGKIEIPIAFLHRLIITPRGEVLFTLSHHDEETVLETLAAIL